MKINILICYSSLVFIEVYTSDDDIVKKRNKLLNDEFNMATGANIELNEEEIKLNNTLMKWKQEEFDYWLKNPKDFNFTKSFFDYKSDMVRSKVYKLIEKMPKGGLLHVHYTAILGPDFYMNATYRDHLFVCFEELKELFTYRPKFKFSLHKPDDQCISQWKLMSDVRASVENVEEFDNQLRKNFTMIGTNYKDVDSLWKHFENIFVVLSGLISYMPVNDDYLYEALKRLREDKIMYVEIRSMLTNLYELDGTIHDPKYFTNQTKILVERFKNEYPDFLGAKIIGSYGRRTTTDHIKDVIDIVKDAKKKFPDFIAGFDLVGHEDAGGPLVDYSQLLRNAKHELDYFFHAGETNWLGTFSDENLIDAVILGTKRIGHGYALTKHPLVLEEVKTKGICVEVSVVSNSVLGLTQDARTHPLATLLALNVTTVAAGDDPGLWGSPPMTADLYVTFMGVAGRRYDLRLLKQLAYNTIHCSALSDTEKQTAMTMFNAQWKTFISESVANID